jgi:hypothetical protein
MSRHNPSVIHANGCTITTLRGSFNVWRPISQLILTDAGEIPACVVDRVAVCTTLSAAKAAARLLGSR